MLVTKLDKEDFEDVKPWGETTTTKRRFDGLVIVPSDKTHNRRDPNRLKDIIIYGCISDRPVCRFDGNIDMVTFHGDVTVSCLPCGYLYLTPFTEDNWFEWKDYGCWARFEIW